MFEREPQNKYDPLAIRISLLDGSQLGYVPKYLTPLFGELTVAGRVESVGMGEAGFFGARVYSQPRLPALLPVFLPESFQHLNDPFQDCTTDQIQRVISSLSKERSPMCVLTGLKKNLKPCVFWRVHPDIKRFEISGIHPIDESILPVMQIQKEEPDALEIITSINGFVRFCFL